MIYYAPIVVALTVYAIRLIEINRKRSTVPGHVQETTTLRLFVLIGTLMTFGSLIEYVLRGGGFSWVALGGGTACAIASFRLRWSAIAALGKFWSLHVEIRENHEFVENGPFQLVRHPTYFSMILELLAFGLILSASR